MSATIDRALALLRDVPGVEGAFVLDEAGNLVARDASMGLPEWLLAGAATRLSTLVESAEDALEPPRELTLVFADRSVLVRVSAPHVLVLLVKPATSMEAVRLASNVALRQIARALLSPPSSEVGGVAPPSSAPTRTSTPIPALASLTPVQPKVSVTLKSPPSATTSPRPSFSGAPVPPSATKPTAASSAVVKKKKNDIWG